MFNSIDQLFVEKTELYLSKKSSILELNNNNLFKYGLIKSTIQFLLVEKNLKIDRIVANFMEISNKIIKRTKNEELKSDIIIIQKFVSIKNITRFLNFSTINHGDNTLFSIYTSIILYLETNIDDFIKKEICFNELINFNFINEFRNIFGIEKMPLNLEANIIPLKEKYDKIGLNIKNLHDAAEAVSKFTGQENSSESIISDTLFYSKKKDFDRSYYMVVRPSTTIGDVVVSFLSVNSPKISGFSGYTFTHIYKARNAHKKRKARGIVLSLAESIYLIGANLSVDEATKVESKPAGMKTIALQAGAFRNDNIGAAIVMSNNKSYVPLISRAAIIPIGLYSEIGDKNDSLINVGVHPEVEIRNLVERITGDNLVIKSVDEKDITKINGIIRNYPTSYFSDPFTFRNVALVPETGNLPSH